MLIDAISVPRMRAKIFGNIHGKQSAIPMKKKRLADQKFTACIRSNIRSKLYIEESLNSQIIESNIVK